MKLRVLIVALACGWFMASHQAGAQSVRASSPPGYATAKPEVIDVLLQSERAASSTPTDPADLACSATSPVLADVTNGDCADCGCCDDRCCVPKWTAFGDLMYIRPRDAAVGYAVAFNGPVVRPQDGTPVQIARPGILDIEYETAFRVGFSRGVTDCSAIAVSFSRFSNEDSSSISTEPPYLIRSTVIHPNTWNDASDGLDAAAAYSMDFDVVDLDYRWTLGCNDCSSIVVLAGARYAHLGQDFATAFGVNGIETVATNVGFSGGGIRVGLEAESRWGRCGLLVYGRGAASLLAGKLTASYAQGTAFDASIVDTGWENGRVAKMADLEVGLGWCSRNDHLRLTAGYIVNTWYNIVKTDNFINAVQRDDFRDMGDTLSFDGLVARAEWRF